jgi:glc operon protein GlcG
METRPTLTLQDAHEIMAACKSELRTNGWNASIAIVDEAGALVLFEREYGIPAVTAEVAIGKAQVSAAMRRPSRLVRDMIKEQSAFMKINGVALQGGVPIVYRNQCVGGIGVSGVSGDGDEQIAVVGAGAVAD